MAPITGIAAIAASLGITVLLVWSGFYHHVKTSEGYVFHYPAPLYWFFTLFSVLLIAGVIIFALLPKQYGLDGLELIAIPMSIVFMLGSIYIKKARIELTDNQVFFIAFKTIKVNYDDIIKIIKYGGIPGSYRRENKACIYMANNKKFVLSGLIVDFDLLVRELRSRSKNAQYTEKK